MGRIIILTIGLSLVFALSAQGQDYFDTHNHNRMNARERMNRYLEQNKPTPQEWKRYYLEDELEEQRRDADRAIDKLDDCIRSQRLESMKHPDRWFEYDQRIRELKDIQNSIRY
jgi:hypothetical protein